MTTRTRAPVRDRMPELIRIVGIGLLAQSLTLISGPLVARMLQPEGRGHFATITVVTLLLSQLALGGVLTSISHFVAVAHGPARDVLRGRLLRWVLAAAAPALVAAPVSVAIIGVGADWRLVAAAAFLLSLHTSWQFLVSAMLRGEGDLRAVNRFRLLGPLAHVAGVVVLFVIHPIASAAALLLLLLVPRSASLTYGWRLLRRPDRSTPAVPVRELRSFARRSYVSGINGLGLGLDHLLVGVIVGQIALGYYAVAMTVTNIPALALRGIAGMLLPRMSALAPAGATALLRRWLLGSVVISAVLVVALVALIGPIIRVLFGAEFVPAVPAARVLAVAWGLLGLRLVLTAALQAYGAAGRASTIEAAGTGALVLFVGIGAQLGGLVGAAVGMVAVAAVSCAALGGVLVRASSRVSTAAR